MSLDIFDIDILFYITIRVCVLHFMTYPLRLAVSPIVSIRRIIYKFLNVCPFDYPAYAVVRGWVPVNQFNHAGWIGVVTPTDRHKSVQNRCVMEVYGGILCCQFLFNFCWHSVFYLRMESDFFLFLWSQNVLYILLLVKSKVLLGLIL